MADGERAVDEGVVGAVPLWRLLRQDRRRCGDPRGSRHVRVKRGADEQEAGLLVMKLEWWGRPACGMYPVGAAARAVS